MAIIKHYPKKTTIRDRRSDEGGYYEAICEECGKTFYPARTALYCSQLCTQRAYMKRKKAGEVKTKQPILIYNDRIKTRNKVIEYLEQNYPQINENDLQIISQTIRELTVNDSYTYTITVSERKFIDITFTKYTFNSWIVKVFTK